MSTMDPFEKSKLDKMERGLYSRKYKEPETGSRSSINPSEIEVNDTWNKETDTELQRLILEKHSKKPSTMTKKIFIGSFIFFIACAAVAATIFFSEINSVSSNNIEISVLGPTSIAAGEELSLDVIIDNGNNTDLLDARILVEYPPGTRVAGDINSELLRNNQDIGDIRAGGQARRTIQAVLFGEREDIKQISITLEYRIKNSNPIYEKEKIYDIAIQSAPIIVTTTVPEEVNSGQEIEMVLEIASNSTDTLENLLLIAEYPSGFTFNNASPEPFIDTNVWRIGTLESGDRRIIRISGVTQGQNEDERTVRFYVGIANPNNERTIGATILSLLETFTIKRSFIDLAISIANDTGAEYIARAGDTVQVNLVWNNNLPGRLLNGTIDLELIGDAFDRNSVSVAGGGFYRSSTNTITWNGSGVPSLQDIPPGGRGVVSFNVTVRNNISATAGNQAIGLRMNFSGNQVLPSGPPQQITSDVQKQIKLSSNLALTARSLYTAGPFQNTGPLPPRAEQDTTYTVVWSLTNTYNTVSGVEVRTTLPPYVSWTDMTNPSGEQISYNPDSREVVWRVGDVASGVGFTGTPREVAFQITLEPSLSQVGSTPDITGRIQYTGQDTYTGRSINQSRDAVSTRITTDPSYTADRGVVVQ